MLKNKIISSDKDLIGIVFFGTVSISKVLNITVFPVKLQTPEKISGMFIVLQPIRREMKPQKITDKPQNGLITT